MLYLFKFKKETNDIIEKTYNRKLKDVSSGL